MSSEIARSQMAMRSFNGIRMDGDANRWASTAVCTRRLKGAKMWVSSGCRIPVISAGTQIKRTPALAALRNTVSVMWAGFASSAMANACERRHGIRARPMSVIHSATVSALAQADGRRQMVTVVPTIELRNSARSRTVRVCLLTMTICGSARWTAG